jgi:hypothetical protein
VTEFVNWRDVKAKARAADPTWDSPERVEQRHQIHEQMIATIAEAGSPRSGLGQALEGAEGHVRPGRIPERGE